MHKKIVLVLLCLIFFKCFSQENDADYHFSLADSLLITGEYDSSYIHFSKASNLYQLQNSLEGYLKSEAKISEVYRFIGEYNKSLELGKTIVDEALEKLDSNELVMGALFFNLGEAYDYLSAFDSAIHFYHKSLKVRLNDEDASQKDILSIYRVLTGIYSISNQFDSTLYYGAKAFSIIDRNPEDSEFKLQSGSIYNDLANTYADMNRNELALKHYKDAAAISREFLGENHINTAITYSNIGSLYKQNQNTYQAKFYLEKALNILSEAPIDKLTKYLIINSLGDIHRNNGEYNKSIDYYERAVRGIVESEGESNFHLAGIYGKLGASYMKTGQFEKAKEAIKKGMELNSSLSKNPGQKIYLLTVNGNLSGLKENSAEALEYYKQALSICEKNFPEDPSRISSVLNNITKILTMTGEFEKAFEFNDRAIGLFLSRGVKQHPALANSYLVRSNLLEEVNKFDSAIVSAEKSLQANKVEDFDLKSKQKVFNKVTNLNALRSKANSLKGKYDQDKNVEDLVFAFSTYKELIGSSLENSFDVKHEDDVIDTYSIVEDAIAAVNIANVLFSITDDASYLNDVFLLFQNSRSVLLTHQTSLRTMKSTCGISDSLQSVEVGLRKERDFYQTEIMNASIDSSRPLESERLNEIKDRLFELDELLNDLEIEYHNKCSEFIEIPQMSVFEAQEKLEKNQVLIQYLTNDDVLYGLVLYNKELKLIELNYAYEGSITSVNNEAARQLYEELIAPLLPKGEISRLSIIPDGKLWGVNFDLLLTEPINEIDQVQKPYLLKKYPINYAYSVHSLFENVDRKKDIPKQLLAISYATEQSVSGNKITLSRLRATEGDLPGSLKEIRSISEHFLGDYIYGEQASERLFKNIASDYKILHLAVHGEIDEIEAQNSKLHFYSKGDSTEDGKLHAFELYNMKLNSDLAVLSACNTGSGEIVTGEGVMSLGRAFTYAGVNSLLLTRSEVSDTFTPRLIELFYEELKNGSRKSDALRTAKLRFLMEGDEVSSDPFYWASFYVLGNDSPINLQAKSLWKERVALILLATLLLIFLAYRFVHKRT